MRGTARMSFCSHCPGELRSAPDKVRILSQPVGDLGPVERRKAGLVAAPEDRYGHAAAPDMSLVENAFLTAGVRKGLVKNGFVDWAGTRRFKRRRSSRRMTCAHRGRMRRRGPCRGGICRSS